MEGKRKPQVNQGFLQDIVRVAVHKLLKQKLDDAAVTINNEGNLLHALISYTILLITNY